MASQEQHPTIVRTSPPRPHPRRPPPQQSVSLRRPPSQKNSASSSGPSVSASTKSPSSLRPLIGRGSSGESSSNAEKWFEQSNNAVGDNNKTSFADNDPPFFMRHSSSSETPPDRQQLLHNKVLREDRANSLPLRTGLLRLDGTDGSTSEDFRSVIDDLTVQNKKLKRRLKKYEKLHDAHLKDDKLFEVRIHGLPPEKKRELEETLQKFASNVHTTGANASPSNAYASLVPTLQAHKTAASSISMQNTDSAYASMSTSGQGSGGTSGNDSKHRMTPISHLASRQQHIHNYLHDIPQGLLPQQNSATLSERAKKKLVVRRMEQIFAGKGAASGGHQHSLQQEEVSQSAAHADRTEIEASGQHAGLEGKREARIMENETEDPLDPRAIEENSSKEITTDHLLKPEPKTIDTNVSPARDQRPTRPLDLDPHRAQVPHENIRYMEHLGFSPPDLRWGKSPADGHGWIYLNFLINMAQLHTINVTSDFVRKALIEFSDKLEISDDGRKIRWRGGQSVTRTSSNSGGASSHDRTSEHSPEGQSRRKRVKLSHTDNTQSYRKSASGDTFKRKQGSTNHFYTPLFFHRDSTDETDDSSLEAVEDDSSSPWPGRPAAGDSSGMTSFGIQTATGVPSAPVKKKAKHENGPIIFYNNARFCTDLSGDGKATNNKNPPAYVTTSAVPIGKARKGSDQSSEAPGPLTQASELPELMNLNDNPISESMEVSFPQRSPTHSSSGEDTDTDPFDLEVTGIGGVWPADNFAISINSRQARVEGEQVPPAGKDVKSKALPPRFAEILRRPDPKPITRSNVHKHVVTSRFRELPPSELPEALSFMPFVDDSTGDDDESDADDSMSDTPDPTGDAPSAAPQPVDLPYNFDEDDTESDYEESDSEVDFLAAARMLNPEAVRQREREYDANMAERLAEEIPAGSSAATAGGGSGFGTPASGVNMEEHRRATREARVQAANANVNRSRANQAQNWRVRHDDDDDAEMSDASS